MLIQSSARRRAPNGGVKTYLLATYGLVQHFLVCQGPTGLLALAFVQSIVTQRDPTGRYGIPEDCRDMHVLSSYEGTHRYIDALSILDSVGCLTWGDRHYIICTREPFQRRMSRGKTTVINQTSQKAIDWKSRPCPQNLTYFIRIWFDGLAKTGLCDHQPAAILPSAQSACRVPPSCLASLVR